MDFKKVTIKWMDAKIYPGMHKVEGALKRRMDVFENLGYMLKRDERATIVAHEYSDAGEYRDILLIPTGSVISIRELETGSPV